jgi:hypothetical protein
MYKCSYIKTLRNVELLCGRDTAVTPIEEELINAKQQL